MILDHAAQFPLHLVVAVFQNLLKLVKHHHHARSALGRDPRRRLQNFLQRRTQPAVLGQAKRQLRLAFLVHRHAG